ncbi:MAG: hypothetical protein ACREQN_11010 [Candidatus Binataceae bacterium]
MKPHEPKSRKASSKSAGEVVRTSAVRVQVFLDQLQTTECRRIPAGVADGPGVNSATRNAAVSTRAVVELPRVQAKTVIMAQGADIAIVMSLLPMR